MGLTTKASYTNVYDNTATVSPFNNVPVVVKGSAGVVFQVEVDNTNNPYAVYARMYDASTGITVTSNEPEHMIKVGGGQTLVMSSFDSISFGTGITVACTTTADLTGASPAGTVVLQVGYT
jgi:hypothetical protein